MRQWLRKWLGIVDAVPVASEKSDRAGFFTTDAKMSDVKKLRPEEYIKRSIQKSLAHSDVVIDTVTADSKLEITAIAEDDSISGLNKAVFGGNWETIPDIQASWYSAHGFIGYQLCAIIAQHWLVDKACSMPGEDALRNGYNITVDGDSANIAAINKHFAKADKKHNIRLFLEEYCKFSRVFGIRHALFLVNSQDPEYYEKPFNIDGVLPGTYQGVSQIDPYWITPLLNKEAASDPSSKHFYEPTYWVINGKKYHKSHFVISIHSQVADILKPSYIYGGKSLPQEIFERVYASERTANEAPQLLATKRATVIHVDIEKALANQKDFEEKMAVWRSYQDNFGVKVVGTEEVIEQFDTTLTDLDTSIMTQFQLVAAIARVPATKLLGTSPKGFNATGEYEESNYHEEVKDVQTLIMQPVLERHLQCVMKSEVSRQMDGKVVEIGIDWCPLDALTTKEQAEINKFKAETGAALVTSGAIDGQDERDRIAADPTSGYTGLVTLSNMAEDE